MSSTFPTVGRSGALNEFHQRFALLVGRFHRLQSTYEQAHDSRCVFTYAYGLITHRIDESLDSIPLADPEWTVTLAEAFASRYFDAVSGYDQGNQASPAWQSVLDAIVRGNSSVLEDLIFPITAHIVHDLPLALAELGPIDAHLHDYDLMNDVLGKSIDLIRDRVTVRYSPGLRWLDRIEKRYDQIASDYGIRMSRGLAWYNAHRLLDPVCRADALAAIESSPQILVANVRHPPVRSIALLFTFVRSIARVWRRWPTGA
jgi:hypothetical protein